MRLISPATAAAVLLCASMPGWADSTATVNVGPVSILLVDLDPTDGIDASIEFGHGPSRVVTFANNSFPVEQVSEALWGDSAWAPVTSSSAATDASAQAALTGSGSAHGSVFNASGRAEAGVWAPAKYRTTEFGASIVGMYQGSFMLSANTQVTFTAEASVAAAVSNAFDPANDYGFENASAYALLNVWGVGASGVGSQSSYDNLGVAAASLEVTDETCAYGYCFAGDSQSDARVLTGSFLNLTSGTLSGQLQMDAQIFGRSWATAVPELETYALLAAGLAVVGGLARRRG